MTNEFNHWTSMLHQFIPQLFSPSLLRLINILLQVISQTLDRISNLEDDHGEKEGLWYIFLGNLSLL